jgi:hypothetical protein
MLVPDSWGYLTENASPITTRNTARIRKGARICAIHVLKELLLIGVIRIMVVQGYKHRKISQECEIG